MEIQNYRFKSVEFKVDEIFERPYYVIGEIVMEIEAE
jgi:hypothetical protein